MINAILEGIFNFAVGLINLLTAPLDSAITEYMPSFSEVLTLFNSFIDYVIQFFDWILSWFHIPPYLIAFVVLTTIGHIMIKLTITPIKLGLKWWHIIVP